MLKYLIFVVFVALSYVYYITPLDVSLFSPVFLSASTFLLAIFAGFFIARQGTRYSAVRTQLTNFDGELSSIYRHFGHIIKSGQKKAKEIIKKYYEFILENRWDYHFVHKSSMISSLYALVDKSVGNKKLSHLNRVATHEILSSLGRLQVLRKNMIALRNERIPAFQWILLYFIGAILLVTISFIPSYNVVLFSVLKGAFGAVVISVFILLHQLDNLKLFRGTIGKASAGDVIDILEGRR